jgi:hypothetical protein
MKVAPNYGRGRLTYLLIFAASLFGLVLPQGAFAEEAKDAVCPQEAGHYACASLATAPGTHREISPSLEGSGELKGLAPKDLREAYKLSETGGSGQTVAIVDAFNDPNAESDLKIYREHYSLSKCTEANGCFKKVNQKGETKNYPENEYEWSLEMSLDLDMVSAICQECHIVLVEAETNSFQHMHEAESEAASIKGVTEISNSWGASERSEETSEESYYNHPGIPTTFSAGDFGYGVEYPAASPHVIAVGGTTLKKAENSRGWTETVWSGTGSGCSQYTEKPKWQTDKGCTHRTNNDVAADASGESPVSVYDSYVYPGWEDVWGTSAASPMISAVEAHASEHTRALGAEAFYQDTSALFDVSSGSNGTCTEEYLCHGEAGYDGPTGNGTPDGVPHVEGWSIEPTPLEPGATESTMTGVSCTLSTACVAVADYGKAGRAHAAYAEKWNGAEWAIQGLPDPSGAKATWMKGVSCAASTSCVAVGYYENSSGVTVTLAYNWSGTEWIKEATPNPSGAKESLLRGVSCTSSTACTAVGSYKNSSGTIATLAERWNGTEWSIQSTPNPTEVTVSVLHNVSCTSSTSCIASADDVEGGHLSAFIEKWNGTEWSIQLVASPSGAQAALLEGISCTSSTACTSVGYYKNSAGTLVTLAERWNGTAWSVQSTPLETEATESYFTGVSCTSSTACLAVANYGKPSIAHATYAERWNGSEWSVQGLPAPGGFSAAWMDGVSCTSSAACTGVGAYTNSGGTTVTLAEGYF